jgi:predicted Zn-dependent peptidase
LTYGALYPNFTQEEFDEKAKLLEGIKAQEKKTAIANRVVNALAFGMKHPRRIHNARNT